MIDNFKNDIGALLNQVIVRFLNKKDFEKRQHKSNKSTTGGYN